MQLAILLIPSNPLHPQNVKEHFLSSVSKDNKLLTVYHTDYYRMLDTSYQMPDVGYQIPVSGDSGYRMLDHLVLLWFA